ncbi:TPR-like protein [Xylona heveae TC161]|uniref:TPR-like protein n=1 Tax=Xylona heveae (strain CBS 132557 / TC161) TaxID=1328760 RepID=A0A165GKV3_XYLHT|nr:TPR-like protein [Xylona heveae TC161]KZF22315.1 TPR-like protein [Xylona heveae TC161]
MAKSKADQKSKNNQKREKTILNTTQGHRVSSSQQKPAETPEALLEQATALLQIGQPEDALPFAERALQLLQPDDGDVSPAAVLPALDLVAEINIELGNIDTARELFLTAASLDPEGLVPQPLGGGAEKFLWLAQLCEQGGAESVVWFEKGAAVLRREIGELEKHGHGADVELEVEEKKGKLANALCGIAEVYMTDLSWEEDAETRCENLVTESLLVAPNQPEALQTLASVRISQTRFDDARAALSRSLLIWKDLPPEDPDVPQFPTRISLARLLMEAEMEEEAIEVLERLITEDDHSVEAWYLGGWCLHLMAEKKNEEPSSANIDPAKQQAVVKNLARASRAWLQNSLRLYQALEYEDTRLGEHATQLVEVLNQQLGDNGEGDDDDEAWEDEGDAEEDEDEDGDQEMGGA